MSGREWKKYEHLNIVYGTRALIYVLFRISLFLSPAPTTNTTSVSFFLKVFPLSSFSHPLGRGGGTGIIYPKEGEKKHPQLFKCNFTLRKGVILITVEPIL